MHKCERCGEEIDFPFKCKFCERTFCLKHRLPENHNCPAPPRTPLGSYQTKMALLASAMEREIKTAPSPVMVTKKKETKTYGNIYGYHFDVPVDVC
ncbi:MAG: AN1-type zinc finger protein [Candidatus Bathyarchaeia archaeon]